jgi:hypothetical protein
MARMIPDACPPDTASPAEAVLFDAFREKLPAPWTVIHSLPGADGREPPAGGEGRGGLGQDDAGAGARNSFRG